MGETTALRPEIEDLREAGEDGGSLMGYFARGHFDAVTFAEAANKYSGAAYGDDRRHVYAKDVVQVWYRTCQMAEQPKGTMEFRPTEPGAKGAWKATVCASVDIHAARQRRRQVLEYDRGYQEGMSRALGFLLSQLEWGRWDDKVSQTMRRSIAAELRESFKRDHEDMLKEKSA